MACQLDFTSTVKKIDLKRIAFILLGIVLFTGFYLIPHLPDAVDPQGQVFELTREGKAALALFLLAAVWWVFEVVPIGITAITIGVIQALFLIRSAEAAFSDFMNPSVWFIFASLVIGRTFTKSGLTQRMAYNMLVVVGEKTSMIYLGSFILIALLTMIMAHTAVAATVYPLLAAIYSLYTDDEKPTRFGKGLFIGMAFVAGAGSIVTLLGAARGAVAIGFYKDIIGTEVSFFDYSYYLGPVGWVMVILLWVFFIFFLKPERRTIPGLRDKAKSLAAQLGPISRIELFTLIIVLGAITLMSLRSFVPALQPLNKSAIILTTTILFFVFKVLTVQDLEEIPWNIILLFGGAMSIGFCLWQTGAAEWLAIHWLALFQQAPWFVFVLGMAIFVLVMTNLIMNVAAIAITMPIALVIAPYLGVAPEVIMFAALATAGMPFLFLVGAAPNAIAYESKQFTSAEFLKFGIPASLLLMIVLAIFVAVVWPLMGMPVRMESPTTKPNLYINEIQINNQSTIQDEAGDYDPWLELYNPASSERDLGGFTLCHNQESWVIPSGTMIKGRGFLIVWLDGEGGEGTLHTSYAVTPESGMIGLLSKQGMVSDSVVYPLGEPGLTLARDTDGQDGWIASSLPTPGETNSPFQESSP